MRHINDRILKRSQMMPLRRIAACLALYLFFCPALSSVVQAQTNPCTDLVTDSSLESGNGWAVKSNGGYTLLTNVQAHTGAHSAYLAGVNNANDLLSTQLTLPASPQSLTLHFWWKVNSEARSDVNDQLKVMISDSAGKHTKVLFTLGSERASNQWQEATLDLGEFAGQAIQLAFGAKTDDTLVTDFFIDDVEVNVCATG